jgi:uncharacterized spore protein YtfJ
VESGATPNTSLLKPRLHYEQGRAKEDEMNVNVNDILQQARDVMNVQRVFGEPIHQNGLTLVPVASVRGGGGGGGGTNPKGGEEGGGVGFGVTARPVGAYIIRGDQVEWRPAVDTTRLITAGAAVGSLAILTLRTAIKRSRRRGRAAKR